MLDYANNMKSTILYCTNEEKTARFVLGEDGKNPLVCIGVNPSKATPFDYDQTMRTLKIVSESLDYNGEKFDGYIMINLYPQRSKYPSDLDLRSQIDLVHQNIELIKKCLKNRDLTIWAAWGTSIEKRSYLKEQLIVINTVLESENCCWVKRGPLSKNGHPHHPLYVSRTAQFEAFDVKEYLNNIKE